MNVAEQTSILKAALQGALDKLKVGMDEGPDGKVPELTPAEATMLYRTLVDAYGIKHDNG